MIIRCGSRSGGKAAKMKEYLRHRLVGYHQISKEDADEILKKSRIKYERNVVTVQWISRGKAKDTYYLKDEYDG